jgi:hypothetical protein
MKRGIVFAKMIPVVILRLFWIPFWIYLKLVFLLYINVKNNGWITKGIKIPYLHKRSLYVLGRNCNDSKLKLYYNWYCAIFLKKSNERGKKLYYNHSIDYPKKKMKTIWNVMKNVTGKVHTSDCSFQHLQLVT